MNTGSKWHAVRRFLPPDREIIVRTGDQVAYLRLPRWLQTSFLMAVAVALAWIALATHLNFSHLDIIARREARIVETEDARRTIERDLLRARKEIAQAAQRDAASRERIERLVEFNQGLKTQIGALEQRIASDQTALEQTGKTRQALAAEVAALRQRLADLDAVRVRIAADADALRADLAHSGKEKQQLVDQVAQLLPRIEALDAERAQIGETAAGLREELARRVAERDGIAAERDRLMAERDSIANRFASLTSQIDVLETAQELIVTRVDSQTVTSIELVEKTLRMTGVDVDRLLGRLAHDRSEGGPDGIGGPFIAAVDEVGVEAASGLANNIAAVEQRIARWRGLQTLLARVPLTVPLDNYHVTSTFGRRIDPLTRRPAMHEGVDFSSGRRAEVRATSPGKVSFVGWRGGYGKMVEVDHGLGIRTRYAHLSKVYVKPGQQVDFRDKLGQVGNTGRSTGEHLHYEVVVDGRALDPANFMKAGQYVFKN